MLKECCQEHQYSNYYKNLYPLSIIVLDYLDGNKEDAVKEFSSLVDKAIVDKEISNMDKSYSILDLLFSLMRLGEREKALQVYEKLGPIVNESKKDEKNKQYFKYLDRGYRMAYAACYPEKAGDEWEQLMQEGIASKDKKDKFELLLSTSFLLYYSPVKMTPKRKAMLKHYVEWADSVDKEK